MAPGPRVARSQLPAGARRRARGRNSRTRPEPAHVTEASPAGWAGRVAVVTGGSRGIGRAVATRFAERGAHVLLTSRKAEAVAAAAESLAGDVVGATADIADVVEFLAGPQSSWLTGQILVVDGGARLVSSTD